MSIQSIVILGSGNVATVLGMALKEAGLTIACVYSRNMAHAKTLANQLQTAFTNQLHAIPPGADLYILAVKDEALSEISGELSVNGIVSHTSGATPLNVLKKHKRAGVFYPLQTFNKNTGTDLLQVPFLIESSSPGDEIVLLELAKKLSNTAIPATSQQRQGLHVAAVFANNFTNHLLVVSKQIMDASGLPFELLKPLIQQTINNALANDPATVQTGPAMRYDHQTIQSHLQLLGTNPDAEKIYRLITESIQRFHPEKP
ncbi:MAG: Rossmann-like and DUF2520 domain-containing protein [Bacteroidota bacterium]